VKSSLHIVGRKEGNILTELYGWLFVDFIPLLYEKRRVARQLQVEVWLDLTQLLNELKAELANGETGTKTSGAKANVSYIV
jgi:hypothetical protein